MSCCMPICNSATLRHYALLLNPKQPSKLAVYAMLMQITLEAATAGTLLPPTHPFVVLIKRVGLRIAHVRVCMFATEWPWLH